MFQEYTTPADPEKVEEFELRDHNGALESRKSGPPSPQWEPYAGGNVFCVGCLADSRGSNYLVYDPRTREMVQP